MSPILQEFYKAILLWVNEDCYKHSIFFTDTGLCLNLIYYATHRKGLTEHEALVLRSEMQDQFLNAELCKTMPFNEDSEHYWIECENYSCYQNPARLEWIKQHAKV